APEPDLVEEEVPELAPRIAPQPFTAPELIAMSDQEIEEIEGNFNLVEPLPEPSFEELMAAAWNTVKGPTDADFAHCDPRFLLDLAYHAKDVQEKGQVLQGDTQLARFEQEFSRLLGR